MSKENYIFREHEENLRPGLKSNQDKNSNYSIRKTHNHLRDCDMAAPQIDQRLAIDPKTGTPIGWEAPNGNC